MQGEPDGSLVCAVRGIGRAPKVSRCVRKDPRPRGTRADEYADFVALGGQSLMAMRIATRVEQELGKPIGELFAEFDPVPLASASVAQVHAARLKPAEDGSPGLDVVVKVLRPGVEAAIEADIELLRTLAAPRNAASPLNARTNTCWVTSFASASRLT